MALLLAALLIFPTTSILAPNTFSFAEEAVGVSVQVDDTGDVGSVDEALTPAEGSASSLPTEEDAATAEQPPVEQPPVDDGEGIVAQPPFEDDTDNPAAGTGEDVDEHNSVGEPGDEEGDKAVDDGLPGTEGEQEEASEGDVAQPDSDKATAALDEAAVPQSEVPAVVPELEQTDGLKVLAVNGVTTLTSQQAEEAGWEFYFNGPTVIISGYTGSDVGAIDRPLWIPAKIDDCVVTTIVPAAFSKNHLNTRELVSVAIPPTVGSIGREAFQGQRTLRQLTLSEGLRIIGISAFEGTGVTAVRFPSTIQTIDDYSFADTEALAEVSFHNRTFTLGDFAFRNTTALKHVALPGNMMAVSEGAFQGSGISTLTLGEGIREIRFAAFENTRLTNLEFPASLKVVGGRAFAGCTQLQTVRIPSTVVNLKFDIFDGVPKSLFGYVEAGSPGLALLRDQGFTDYEVTARSEKGNAWIVFRKDVLPDDVKVTVTEFSDEMLQQVVPIMDIMWLQLVASYQIELSVDGVPVIPTKNLQICLAFNPLLVKKTLMLFEIPDSDKKGEEEKKQDEGSVLGALSFVPSEKVSTKVDGYLAAAYQGMETLKEWSGNYFICAPLDPEDRPQYVDPDEERRSHGHTGITHTFGDNDTAALMTREEGPRYEGRAIGDAQIIGSAIMDKFLAQTATEAAIPEAAIPEAALAEAGTVPGAAAAPMLAVRVAGMNISAVFLFILLAESIVLGIALFYIGKALRAKYIERHL
jgi:hypothetical protein